MSRIYLAGPLFCEAEKAFNLKVTTFFENKGYDVFLPQRDGILAAETVGKTEKENVNMIFKKDVSAINSSDILVMILDGRVPDEGACVELGIAYALGKRCYGIRTDDRSLEANLSINPLLAGCFIKIFENSEYNALIEEIENYLKQKPL